MIDINIIIKELEKLTSKAIKNNEVPVAALLIKNNKIISKAYNNTNKSKSILDHAEIICIKKASKKIGDWRLNDCELFVTLEPCSMCKEVIKKSRISRVYYFIKQNNYETENNPQYNYINNNKFADELSYFFQSKRNN